MPLCCGLAIWKRRGKNITPEVPVIILRFPLIILGSRRPDQVAERYGSMWGSPFGLVFGWAREKKRASEEEERAKRRGQKQKQGGKRAVLGIEGRGGQMRCDRLSRR